MKDQILKIEYELECETILSIQENNVKNPTRHLMFDIFITRKFTYKKKCAQCLNLNVILREFYTFVIEFNQKRKLIQMYQISIYSNINQKSLKALITPSFLYLLIS